ncbi:MAG: anthranilate synthase component I [Rhodospirillales bacterium]|nr:anthranilate synthase component I [Rhodospirillales bacterium]
MDISPDLKTFQDHFNAGRSQLVWQWIAADLETPVSAYLKLCNNEAYSFLLESVEGGENIGRYSAIGLNPDLIWTFKDGDTLDTIKDLVRKCKIDHIERDMPPMAASGLFGYMGYDMIRLIENIPDSNPDELGIPQSIMIRPTVMVIFDNVKHKMCVATPVRAHKNNSDQTARAAYDEAAGRIQDTLLALRAPVPYEALDNETQITLPLDVKSNVTPQEFYGMVEKAKDYILAGDIFQAVIGQRFSCDFDLPSFDLYRALRRVNPSPFLFHLNFDDFSLIGSSPEILVRVRGKKVTVRPIAGTRPRGKTPEEDKALAEDLLSDPKERAEHLMLIDLARNDVGKIAEIGSVKVTDQFFIELYSHVMHIVSNVEGTLRPDVNSFDALLSGFPHGTVTGAPKIRAMEIIDELEPVRRSFYAGAVGYLDGNGDVDTCIALRTGLIKDGKFYVQAGAGVVADSVPESEQQECINKSKALLTAAEEAVRTAQLRQRQNH